MRDDGKRLDFNGYESREPLRPKDNLFYSQLLTNPPELLAEAARDYGYELYDVLPAGSPTTDPYVLFDRFGHIAHRWPDNYVPDLIDVISTCQRLNK